MRTDATFCIQESSNKQTKILKIIFMKKLLAFILLALLVSSCFKKIRSNNNLRPLPSANKEVGVNYFSAISVAGSVDVYYEQGTRNYVKFVGPESLLKYYGVEVKENTLCIAPRGNGLNVFKDDQDVKIIVSSTDLIEVAIAGSGEFHSNKHLDTDRLRLKVAGSGDIDMMDVICDDITCDIAGSGDIKVRQVTTGNAQVSIAGSGDIAMNFLECASVKVKIAGSGDVKLKGKADKFDMKVAGSGKVDTSELITK